MEGVRQPLLVVLAGINGAGKSTFYFQSLRHLNLPFVNADLIAAQLWPQEPFAHAYEAAERAAQMRDQFLARKRSFVTETVFSHVSKVSLIEKAKGTGYRVILIYIHLDGSDLARMRVEERVGRGGHPVPDEKIIQRFPRLLKHLHPAIAVADVALLYDNSILGEPFRHIATVKGGVLQATPSQALPEWASKLLQHDSCSRH